VYFDKGTLASGFLIYAAPTGLHKLTAITYIFSLP
jgi:hypothetical protein